MVLTLETHCFRLGCEVRPLLLGVIERTDGAVRVGGHEGDDGHQGGADAPGWLPVLRVVLGDAQAHLNPHFEAPIRLQDDKR